MMPTLKIDNLRICSHHDTLVDGLSLTAYPGEPITILGETGSGKSLLAHTIMGDLPPNLTATGSVVTAGKDMLQSEQRFTPSSLWGQTIVMLPQEPTKALSPLMRLRQQVREVFHFVKGLTGAPLQTASHQALQQVRLDDAGDKVPSQLSGGMAQRAAFACAAASPAAIMIADEPTKGLDSHTQAELGKALGQFAQTGTLLTITHDIALARSLGGKVIIMQQGKVVESGAADTLLNTPQSAYGQALINALPENWLASPARKTDFPPLITLQHGRITRGSAELFKNVSITLGRGEIVGLYGASGSGKSTLANVLLGLLPVEGTVELAEPLARHQMLKIYQDPPNAFAKGVALITLLEELIAQHRLDPTPLDPLITRLGLSRSLLERDADSVSGGELQRVALLRALLLKPAFLVADEPTSRLDPVTSQRVCDLLVSTCRERQCTLLFISHDKQQLAKRCDRIIDIESLQR